MSPRHHLAIGTVLGGLALLATANVGAGNAAGGAEPVSLDVRVKLTDLDYKPLLGAAVRLVFGSDPRWRSAGTGHRFVTDANGEHRFTARVALDTRLRKRPTNFVSSLLSRKEPTDHLTVGAEMKYMGHGWLYAVDVYRFPTGDDVLLDGFTVYTPDARGDFTRESPHDANGWRMADLGGLVPTSPGYDAWNFMLQPDPADPTRKRWTLRLAYKKSPAPVRR